MHTQGQMSSLEQWDPVCSPLITMYGNINSVETHQTGCVCVCVCFSDSSAGLVLQKACWDSTAYKRYIKMFVHTKEK